MIYVSNYTNYMYEKSHVFTFLFQFHVYSPYYFLILNSFLVALNFQRPKTSKKTRILRQSQAMAQVQKRKLENLEGLENICWHLSWSFLLQTLVYLDILMAYNAVILCIYIGMYTQIVCV